MTDRKSSLWSIIISVATLAVLALGSWQSRRAFQVDYDASVFVRLKPTRLINIPLSNFEFDVTVTNTSKRNIQYYLKVETNMGCLKGRPAKPMLNPCGYISPNISLIKQGAGISNYRHEISMDVHPGAVDMSPLAYQSKAEYFLGIKIVNAQNGKRLFQSVCYYIYIPRDKAFRVYDPALDTAGKSKKAKCEAI